MKVVTDPRIQLVPAARRAHVGLAMVMALPLAIVAGVHVLQSEQSGHALTWPSILSAGFIVVLWIALDRLMRRHRLSLDGGVLDVRTAFYRRQVPIAQLDLVHARVLRLQEQVSFKPMLKLNGYALPGFNSGHFLLRDRSRAFVATAGGDRVLWLPVTGKPALLLEPRDPGALLATLQGMAGSIARQ